MLTIGLLFGLNAAMLGNVAWKSWAGNNRQFFPFALHFLHATDAIFLMTTTSLFLLYYCMLGLKYLMFGGGRLRLVEEEHLREWGWMTASESLLAMTIFRNQFDATFIVIFAIVLAVKAGHWVAKDRLDMVEQSARLPENFHTRVVFCLGFLFTTDLIGLVVCAQSLVQHGPSMAILFASDFTILLIGTGSMITKYCISMHEQYRRKTPGNENYEMSLFGVDRSTLIFYFDFWVDLCKLSVYLVFFMVIIVFYGLPLHLFRELYLTVASFVKRVQDVIKYRQATENMNARYRDAREEDLERVHRTCIICREDMRVAEHGKCPKVLNCGHSFHFRCLRSWLERQQSCPTCRRNVLEVPPGANTNHTSTQSTPTTTQPDANAPSAADGGNTENVRESIESLKKQMEELQRNVSETATLVRSMSASLSTSASPSRVPSATMNDLDHQPDPEAAGE